MFHFIYPFSFSLFGVAPHSSRCKSPTHEHTPAHTHTRTQAHTHKRCERASLCGAFFFCFSFFPKLYGWCIPDTNAKRKPSFLLFHSPHFFLLSISLDKLGGITRFLLWKVKTFFVADGRGGSTLLMCCALSVQILRGLLPCTPQTRCSFLIFTVLFISLRSVLLLIVAVVLRFVHPFFFYFVPSPIYSRFPSTPLSLFISEGRNAAGNFSCYGSFFFFSICCYGCCCCLLVSCAYETVCSSQYIRAARRKWKKKTNYILQETNGEIFSVCFFVCFVLFSFSFLLRFMCFESSRRGKNKKRRKTSTCVDKNFLLPLLLFLFISFFFGCYKSYSRCSLSPLSSDCITLESEARDEATAKTNN